MMLINNLILSILLYIIGHRVSSVLLFFFFLTGGFQVVPYPLFETFIGFNKSMDFAFLYTVILFVYGLLRYPDFIPHNPASKILLGYFILLCVCMGASFFYYHIPIAEIIRTSRGFFVIFSYFVIRRITQEQFTKILYALFIITLFLCILFALQAFTGVPLLQDALEGQGVGFIHRFYNSPSLLLYPFAFILIFSESLKTKYGKWPTILLIISVFLPLSRSAVLVFLFLLIVGALLKIGDLKRLTRYSPIILTLLIPILALTMHQLQGRTMVDIQKVLDGEFIDLVETDEAYEMDNESTMLFRMALLFERMVDIADEPQSIIFGKGLCADGTSYTQSHFDYSIGLDDETTGGVVQLYSPDISWPNLFLRYGFVGTAVFLFGIFYLMYVVNKRKSVYSIPILLFLMQLIMNSFTSDLLFSVASFIFPFFLFDSIYYGQTCFKEEKSKIFLE